MVWSCYAALRQTIVTLTVPEWELLRGAGDTCGSRQGFDLLCCHFWVSAEDHSRMEKMRRRPFAHPQREFKRSRRALY
jgi:hypothetical protein